MNTKSGLLAVLCLAISTPFLWATDYFVTTNGDDTFTGLSWDTAWSSITNAVVQANLTGGTISISNGVYTCTNEMLIATNLTIRGVNGAALTVIARVASGDTAPKHRIFKISHTNAVLDGLTISNGNAAANAIANSGGGVYMSVAATISNCVFRNNRAWNDANWGAAIYMADGLVENCQFYDNNVHSGGGAVYMIAGTVRKCIMRGNIAGRYGGAVYMTGANAVLENCLIVNSTIGTSWSGTERPLSYVEASGRFDGDYYENYGGGVYNNLGTLRNCTIVSNRSFGMVNGTGQGLYMTGAGAKAINCIVFYNGTSRYTSDRNDLTLAGGSVTYSCVGSDTSGDGNTILDPDFMDLAGGDYTLRPMSPCLDKGTNIDTMATDLAGNARRIDGRDTGVAQQDMGAYETMAANTGAFRVNATAPTNETFDSLDAVLSAYAAGADTNTLTYYWDLNNDGLIDATTPQVNYTFSPATNTITLTVSNATEGATLVKRNYIRVAPSVIYVATNGAHVYPFHTLANAATGTTAGFNAAIDVARVTLTATSRIQVASGAYNLTGHIVLDKGIVMKSVGGAKSTLLRRTTVGTYRVLNVLFSGSIADGFTITNGYVNYHQGAGGGVLVAANGMLRNSIVADNQAQHGSSWGGGGILIQNGGVVRNCLVMRNSNYLYGGGIATLKYPANAFIQNCTIVSNKVVNTPWRGGGVYAANSFIVNCIITDNINTNGLAADADRYGGNYTYSCSPGLTTGLGNTGDPPLFVSAAAGDYRLKTGSPCINTGSNATWMAGATDLAGSPRLIKQVEMGAYEWLPPPGTMIQLR